MDLHQLDHQRHTVATDSGEVSYLDVGDGPVALFVHGVGTNAFLWRKVIGQLGAERRCIAPDLPLHGRTPAPPGPDFSLGGLAAVLGSFVTALGLRDVDLVANDTGGAVAQIFATRHPERLATLTLTNCETHDNVPPPAFQPTVDLAAAGELAPGAPALLADLESARAILFGSSYEHVEALDLDVVDAYLQPVLGTPERARSFEQFLVSLRPDDLLAAEADLTRLNVPTLVVWGTDDGFFDRSWAAWLRDTIPGVTDVVDIDGGRLFFPDERAGELVDHLRVHWGAHRPVTRPT